MEKTRLFVRFRRSIAWALQTCKSWRKRRSDQCTTSRAWQRGLKTSNNSPFRVDKSKLDTKCLKEPFYAYRKSQKFRGDIGRRAIVAMLILRWICWHSRLVDSEMVNQREFDLSRNAGSSNRDSR